MRINWPQNFRVYEQVCWVQPLQPVCASAALFSACKCNETPLLASRTFENMRPYLYLLSTNDKNIHWELLVYEIVENMWNSFSAHTFLYDELRIHFELMEEPISTSSIGQGGETSPTARGSLSCEFGNTVGEILGNSDRSVTAIQ